MIAQASFAVCCARDKSKPHQNRRRGRGVRFFIRIGTQNWLDLLSRRIKRTVLRVLLTEHQAAGKRRGEIEDRREITDRVVVGLVHQPGIDHRKNNLAKVPA